MRRTCVIRSGWDESNFNNEENSNIRCTPHFDPSIVARFPIHISLTEKVSIPIRRWYPELHSEQNSISEASIRLYLQRVQCLSFPIRCLHMNSLVWVWIWSATQHNRKRKHKMGRDIFQGERNTKGTVKLTHISSHCLHISRVFNVPILVV